MPNVTIERKITKAPVTAEVYYIVDSSRKVHTITFVNGKATVNLPTGPSVIVVGFAGNVGSKVTLTIKTPVKDHARSVSIQRNTSILTTRYFDV